MYNYNNNNSIYQDGFRGEACKKHIEEGSTGRCMFCKKLIRDPAQTFQNNNNNNNNSSYIHYGEYPPLDIRSKTT